MWRFREILWPSQNISTLKIPSLSCLSKSLIKDFNAYEIEDGQEIILDLSPSDPYALRDYLSLENMLNPPDFSNGTTPMAGAEVTRYHIYLDTGSVEATTFPNLLNGSRYINAFDFPTINEAYRGKEVSI